MMMLTGYFVSILLVSFVAKVIYVDDPYENTHQCTNHSFTPSNTQHQDHIKLHVFYLVFFLAASL